MGDKLSQMQPGSKVHNVLNISDVSITVYQLKETGLRAVIDVKVQIISAAKSHVRHADFAVNFLICIAEIIPTVKDYKVVLE